MLKRTRSYSSWRLEKLSDPERAARYLSAALNDSTEAFLHAFKNVLQAHQVSTIAKKAGVTRESLYRSFSASGNPKLDTLQSVLQALDLKISGVEPQIRASSVTPLHKAGKPTGFRKSRRHRRGVAGHPRQLSLPFDASPTSIAAVPRNTGVRLNLAPQRQVAGGAVLQFGFRFRYKSPSQQSPGIYSLCDTESVMFRQRCLLPLAFTMKGTMSTPKQPRSEEHTSELQSRPHLVCRLLLEKK